MSVKPISETRWECMIDSVKSFHYQPAAVYDALVEVSENANDTKAKTKSTKKNSIYGNFSLLVRFIV